MKEEVKNIKVPELIIYDEHYRMQTYDKCSKVTIRFDGVRVARLDMLEVAIAIHMLTRCFEGMERRYVCHYPPIQLRFWGNGFVTMYKNSHSIITLESLYDVIALHDMLSYVLSKMIVRRRRLEHTEI